MYIKRNIENAVLKASKQYPALMVTGQRQVGKSTMLYHIKEESRGYVTFDDINARRLAENDPALFFETYPAPLIIDEFQRVPSILLELKRIIDKADLEGKDNSGMYWLTGSQRFEMMQGISESLAGRVAVFDMTGFSSNEIVQKEYVPFSPDISSLKARSLESVVTNTAEIFQRIFKGSMPKLYVSDINRDEYYMDYVNTYLERDVREMSQIGKLHEFYDFLVFMAARTGQELKYQDIANSIGISTPTAKEWVSLLERSGVIYILRPYYSNISKRLVKTPKFYFMDTGLAAYLCRWPTPETLANGAMDGAFFETFVVSEIIKNYYNRHKKPDLYYYRDIDRKEIDLLIVEGNKAYPIEIKKGKNPSHPGKNFSVLEKFRQEYDIQPGLIICTSDSLVPYSRDIWYCPIGLI